MNISPVVLTNQLEGDESLKSKHFLNYLRNSLHFIKPEESLPCWQEPANGPYPEPDESHFTEPEESLPCWQEPATGPYPEPDASHFTEPEESLPCLQEPANGPYPEPDASRPHPPIYALATISMHHTLCFKIQKLNF
jgi:hypothetical protein